MFGSGSRLPLLRNARVRSDASLALTGGRRGRGREADRGVGGLSLLTSHCLSGMGRAMGRNVLG